MNPDPTFPAERLSVPVRWWLLGTAFVLTIGVAVFAALGPGWGLAVFAASELLLAAGLVAYGSVRVAAEPDGVRVGRAWIGYDYVSAVRALDADQTRRRLRGDADPAAYLVIRPYIRTSVEVTVDDPADPHPYWLVSARNPERLVRAVSARRARQH